MKGLHPEYLLGKKSDNISRICNAMAVIDNNLMFRDEFDMKAYAEALKLSHREINQLKLEINSKMVSEEMLIGHSPSDDSIDTNGFTIKLRMVNDFYEQSKTDKAHIYSVGKRFFNSVALLKRKIPIKYLNGKKIIYIKTPTTNIGGIEINGAYISAHPETAMINILFTLADRYTIMGSRFTIIGDASEGFVDLEQIESIPELDGNAIKGKNSTIHMSDMIYIANPEDNLVVLNNPHGDLFTPEQEGQYKTYLTGLLNTAIYINSQDPVIDELKTKKEYSKKQIGGLGKSKKKTLCNVPVKLVNWEYHTGRNYTCGETQVSAHMRWQQCGVDRSEVKLIWVREHTRNYGTKNN